MPLKYIYYYAQHTRPAFNWSPAEISACLAWFAILDYQNKIRTYGCDSVRHVPDTCSFDDKSPAVHLSRTAGRRYSVRNLSHSRGRSCCCGFCSDPDRHAGRAGSVDSGQAGTMRDRTPIPGRTWPSQIADADAAFPAGGCDGCGRRGLALHGAGGCGRRDSGQPRSSELQRDEAIGATGRSRGSALLADPAERDRRSECRARPLADCHVAIPCEPRRCPRTRQSALAGGVVPVARWATGRVGGAV